MTPASPTCISKTTLEQVVVPAFYRRRHRIYLIQDNASYHKKQETSEWFKANRRYVEVFQLPPYWPELNATERIWNYTRKHVTHNRFFERPQDLRDAFVRKTFCQEGATAL
jgi:transposase